VTAFCHTGGWDMGDTLSTMAKYIQIEKRGQLLNYYKFLTYELYLNPYDMRLLMNSLVDKLKPLMNEIDYFVPLIQSGIPMAGWLQQMLERPVFITNRTDKYRADFVGQLMQQRAKLCYVDSNINRTSSFRITTDRLNRLNLNPHRIVVLFYNDLWGNPDSRFVELHDRHRVIFLHSASELKEKGFI
jgi:hypothetical protein